MRHTRTRCHSAHQTILRVLMVLAAAVVTLTLAACGGDETSTPTSSGPGATPTQPSDGQSPTPPMQGGETPEPTATTGTTAEAPDVDFSGQTGQVIVGFTAGGTYDFWAREIARHIGK
jgi:hypothetical protein